MEKYIPNIDKKLNKYQAYPTMYASQWFFTLFTNCLPFEVIARMFDCYLLEGEKIIFKSSIGNT